MKTKINRHVLLNAFVWCLAITGSAVAARAQAAANSSAVSGWVPKSIAYIKASNTSHDDQFGYSIALSGDGNTLAVGSVNESSGAKGINGNQADRSALNSGAVYVYTRRGGAWIQQAYIKASNTHEGAQFGSTIALDSDGNTMAVSAYLEDSSATGINGNQADHSKDSSGAVYIFTRTGANWSQQAYVKASNTGEGHQFGFALSFSADGNTLAASAIEEGSRATGVNGNQADDSAPGAGAVYIFTRTETKWSQQAYVKPDALNEYFGYSVSLSTDGNTMAVGAPNAGAGEVYAFVRAGSTWTKQTHFKAMDEEQNESFGWSVAISGDGNTIAAGSTDRGDSAGTDRILVRDGGTWTQQARFKGANTRKNDQFGICIAISADGNTVAVGSHFNAGPPASVGVNSDPEDDDVSGSGSVYIFARSNAAWKQAAYVKAPNARVSAEFGKSISLSSDGKTLAAGSLRETSAAKGVNGNQADTSAPDAGAAYVFY
jgi:hypothetical protein